MKVRKKRKHAKHHEKATAAGDGTFLSSEGLGRLRKFVLPAVVFFWPVLYLFRHIFPINGQYTAIGNDFIVLYYKYKVYLLACLNDFNFPLWSPAEAAGYPFYVNPFAQAFYPFNLILVVWYKIAGGYSPLDHQAFTVLGISIFALGLFMWLRLLNSNVRAVVFSVLVMAVSFKMTEIMRFPNAVHTAAWYPWVLYSVTKIMLSQSLRKAALYGVLLTFSLICLCTGGYPYFVYYSQFLFIPYFIVFMAKPLRVRLISMQAINYKRALIILVVAGIAAAVVCGPYVLGIKQLMSETVGRAGRDFDYSTQHVFGIKDTLGSLVYPPAASTEGWYFFSITGLLLIFLYLLTGRPIAYDRLQTVGGENQIPATRSSRELWLKLFFIIWFAVITYITYGRPSYLFIFLWKFMPGFSSLRVWGRLNIVLVPIIAWLLSIAYAWFESLISDRDIAARRKRLWLFSPAVTAVAVYAAVLGVQFYLHLNKVYNQMWLEYFESVSSHDIKFIIYGVAAFVAVFSILILRKWVQPRSNLSLNAILAVLVLVASVEMRHTGARTWTYQGKVLEKRVALDVAKTNEDSFRFRRTDYDNSISLRPNFSVGVLHNWYFVKYNKFLKETEDELGARKTLLGVRDARKLFFSESVEHSTVKSFLSDAERHRPAVKLLSYTGDELNLEITAPVKGYLSFIDNWCRGWKVFVDKEEADMELLFGAFKAVQLTPGRHNVRFSYQPGLF